MARNEWDFRIEVAFGVENAHLAQLHPDAFDPLENVKFGMIIRAGFNLRQTRESSYKKKGANKVTHEENRHLHFILLSK